MTNESDIGAPGRPFELVLPPTEKTPNLNAALAKAQTEIFNPTKNKEVSFAGKDGKPGRSYEYAELYAVIDIIKPPLSKNGVIFRQTPTWKDGKLMVRLRLAHSSGEESESFYPMYPKEDARMTAEQAFAGSFTYAKRQQLKGEFGLSDDSEDKDGQEMNADATVAAKSPRPAPTPTQKASVQPSQPQAQKTTSQPAPKPATQPKPEPPPAEDDSWARQEPPWPDQDDRNGPGSTIGEPGDFVVTFGKKYKGQKLKHIPANEMSAYLEWMEGNAAKSGMPLSSESNELKIAFGRYQRQAHQQ